MRNRRVLVLNHFAAPRGEAGGTRHVELFSRLAGWDHLIIASDLNPQTGRRVSDCEGFVTVPVTGYSSNGLSRILNWVSYAIMATLKGLRVGRVDVVYGSSPHLLAALAAWVLSIAKRAPFVLEVRDLWPKVLVDMNHMSESSPVYRLLTMLEEFLYARASTIVIMAEGSRIELVSRGVADEKIIYIPNGADPEDFKPSLPRDLLRDKYGFDRITAVYAGAHGPANGLQLLIEAAAESPDIDIVLVGGGVLKDSLKAEATRRGLKNIRFKAPIPKDEIPDLLSAADIGLHVLTDVELFRTAVSPNKVFDYMAAGIPTLTNCPGLVTELVEMSKAGIGAQPDGIGDALSVMASWTTERRRQAGMSGQRWIKANQSRTAMAHRLAETLNRLVGMTTQSDIVLDITNQRRGGGQQVALATLEAFAKVDRRPPVACLAGSSLERTARENDFPVITRRDSISARIWRNFAPTSLVNRDIRCRVSYTVFGPPLRGRHIEHTVVGVAYSNLFYPEIRFWKNKNALRRALLKIKDRGRLARIQSADAHIYETSAVSDRAKAQHQRLQDAPSLVMPPSPRIAFYEPSHTNPQAKWRPHILLAASWHPNKNLDKIPAVARELSKIGTVAEFVITIDEHSQGGRTLTHIASEAGASDQISLVGPLGPTEIKEAILTADAILLISELESFSNNIIEAFASKTPLVLSDRDWARAIAGAAAEYAEPNNPKSIAQAINRALSSPRAEELVQAGTDRLREFPNPEERALSILAFVDSLKGQKESQ